MSSWFDRFNKIWASGGVRDDPTDAQANVGWAYIGQAPPTVEQFNATHQWWDQKDNWLYNQIAQVIISAGMSPSESDLTQLLKAIRAQQRYRLSAPLTLFVDSVNGNDSNTGAQGSPFKTINRAVYFVTYQIDQGGQQVTLQLAPGTYDPAWINTPGSLGQIVIQGDGLNPRGYLLKNTNGPACVAQGGARLHFQGVSFEAGGPDQDYTVWGVGIETVQGSVVTFMDVAFGPCSHGHIWSSSAAYCSIADLGLSYTIYGGGGLYHIASAAGGISNIARAHVTVQNNPHFTQGFAQAGECGIVQAWSCTFTGTATGARFLVSTCSIVQTAGGGLNYLPGSLPGIADAATYGVYS
jgi:hypothetical protein